MSWLRKSAPALVVLLAFACGVDQVRVGDSSDDDGNKVLPDSLSKVIGPRGGEIRIVGVTLTVPEGALSADTLLTLANLGDEATSKLTPLKREVRYLARPTVFTPHGQAFEKPVHVSMTLTAPPSSMMVQRLDNELDATWDVIESEREPKGVTFDTDHFSIYALTSMELEGAGGSYNGSGGFTTGAGGLTFGGSGLGGGRASGGASAVGGASAIGGASAVGGSFGGEAGALGVAGEQDMGS